MTPTPRVMLLIDADNVSADVITQAVERVLDGSAASPDFALLSPGYGLVTRPQDHEPAGGGRVRLAQYDTRSRLSASRRSRDAKARAFRA